MKKAWEDVKSFITILMTLGLIALLFIPEIDPPKEVLALYCTSYGSILTYYFNRKKEEAKDEDQM